MKRVDIGVNMRTITEKLSARLKAQAKEAGVVGLKKLGQHLTRLSKTKTRLTNSSYVYSAEALGGDVERLLWKAALRAADYYDCHVNAEIVQEHIESLAKELIGTIRKQANIKHGIGAYEPVVPGEVAEEVLIEVD